jgi:hypothetical protein
MVYGAYDYEVCNEGHVGVSLIDVDGRRTSMNTKTTL